MMRNCLWLHLGAKRFSTAVGKKPIPRVDPTTCKTPYDDNPGANVHLINQLRHKTMGSIYAEDLGPDVHIVYIADPHICRKVFCKEGPHPMHLIPRPWQLFNEKYKVKRGLLFLDDMEWYNARSKLNKFFFAKGEGHDAGVKAADKFVNYITSCCQQEEWTIIKDLGTRLETWSVECSLNQFFGSHVTQVVTEDIVGLVSSVNNIFKASAKLQFLSSEKEAEANSELWQHFCYNTNAALSYAKSMTDKSMNHFGEDSLIKKMLKVFSFDEVVPLILDTIIAATNSTSVAALMTLHQISLDSACQEVIRNNPKYARWCIKESMRMYPVAPFITRILREDFDPGDNWQAIPAGTLILMSTYTMSYDEQYFPDANRFWPDRFNRSDNYRLIGVNEAMASLPFGHGPRSCIGRQIAMDHLLTIISHMTNTVDMKSMNDQPAKLTMSFIGCPDRKILISCRRR